MAEALSNKTDETTQPAESGGLCAPRTTPCASYPYRVGVPSGIWDEVEYLKLVEYDREMIEQPTARFMCHQGNNELCAGWLGHADPLDLLAVRMGLIAGDIDPSCANYSTDVELFDSGPEAQRHGCRDIGNPNDEARAAIKKITAMRARSAVPLSIDKPID